MTKSDAEGELITRVIAWPQYRFSRGKFAIRGDPRTPRAQNEGKWRGL